MASISPEASLCLWPSDDLKPQEKTGDTALALAILRAQLKQNKILVPPGEQCVKVYWTRDFQAERKCDCLADTSAKKSYFHSIGDLRTSAHTIPVEVINISWLPEGWGGDGFRGWGNLTDTPNAGITVSLVLQKQSP